MYKLLRERMCVKQGWETSSKTLLIAEVCETCKWARVGRRNRLSICKTECVLLFFISYFFFFVCIELNFRIAKLWWFSFVVGLLWAPTPWIAGITATSGGKMVDDRGMVHVKKVTYAVPVKPGWGKNTEVHESKYCSLFDGSVDSGGYLASYWVKIS